MVCEKHEKDVVMLMTVRALVYEGRKLIGDDVFAKDPLGMMMMDVVDELEHRIVDVTRADLGLVKP